MCSNNNCANLACLYPVILRERENGERKIESLLIATDLKRETSSD